MKVKSKKSVKDVLVKIYLDPDQFLIVRDICEELGLSHSSTGRALFRHLVGLYLKAKAARNEGSNLGLLLGVPPAGSRVNYGSAPVHLLL